MKKIIFASTLVAVSLASSVASAAGSVDASAVISQISGDGTAALTGVGGAIIGLAGIAVVFKWVKGAIFG